MVRIDDDYLMHYGTPRRSGRYPWGSGGNVDEKKSKTFLDWVRSWLSKGYTEAQVAQMAGMSTTKLRAEYSVARNAEKAANIAMAERLRAKGLSHKAIGQRMGGEDGAIPESTIRSWLAPGAADRADILTSTANMLRKHVEEKGVIDVGKGNELYLGVSGERLRTALAILEKEGYKTHIVGIPQQGTDNETKVKVLAKPEYTQKEIWQDPTLIQTIPAWSNDGGRSYMGIKPPIGVDPKRVQVAYEEDGGATKDGVIYVRPGVDDVSLDGNRYAQVRVQVGDSHYLKGMAMYSDDLPSGVDLVFHTNKSKSDPKIKSDLDAMKPLENDPDNPFGTQIRRQILKDPNDPNSDVKSAMNLVYEEGNWGDWSKAVASQVLSKQEPKLAKEMLDATYDKRAEELDEIMSLTNPTVKKKLLQEFADKADAAAVHLKAAGFERQGWHAILPVDSLSPNQVFAPNYQHGERVALIRYPHGGTFEIPDLVVNNRHPEASRLIGKAAKDAIGIHHSVAERLSGADFDGDTVLVIPNNKGQLKISPALEGLKGFDPRTEYRGYDGMKVMSNTQTEMGKISNLITDMTIIGAPHSEIVRAVRHSMVVIDAEKHKLNHQQSYDDNGIKDLVDKYQRRTDGTAGAATLVSRASAQQWVPARKPRPASEGGPIDPLTGERVYVPTGEINRRTGKPKKIQSKQLAEVSDARKLSSGTPTENLYADYSNGVKALANRARLETLKTPRLEYSKTARKTYATEVSELEAALNNALRNAPLERQAQILAKSWTSAKKADNPSMDKDRLGKIKAQHLAEARARTGAGKTRIVLTPRQWEAIQAGAISDTKLKKILDNADMDVVREFATPRTKLLMTPSKSARAKRLLASGNTRAEVAKQLGVSLTTLDRSLKG